MAEITGNQYTGLFTFLQNFAILIIMFSGELHAVMSQRCRCSGSCEPCVV